MIKIMLSDIMIMKRSASHAVALLQDSEVCLQTTLQQSHIAVAAVQQAGKELLDLFD